MLRNRWIHLFVCLTATAGVAMPAPALAEDKAGQVLKRIGVTRGICVLLGDPQGELALDLARSTELLVYVQLPRPDQTDQARRALDAAGFYGTRVYVETGALSRLHLADNLADAVVAQDEAVATPQAEVLRVLRPQGKALLGSKELIKPALQGADDWSHPYHGPDNNPQSQDRIARAPYLTQFLAEPRYGPSPQVAVASAGRVFKAFGNVAWHEREEPFLNTLVAFNGYNGTILWKRGLAPGVVIHRNTMIATPSTLYVGDDKSCKVIDAATGQLVGEIAPPQDVAGGTFWKWMGMHNGVLYAVTGDQEQPDPEMRWDRKEHGWPWDRISQGYNRPEHTLGFGRAVLAIDPATKQVLWSRQEQEQIDCRAVCMGNGRIFIFRFGSFLACLDAKTGADLWRKTKQDHPEFFEALGQYNNRQGWQTNWRTTAYLKCSDKALYFAGPQVGKLLAVSTEDGRILWENPYDNFQLILRDDGLYGISGEWASNASKRLDPLTGVVLADLNIGRRGCTRPTGAIDAIFFRAKDGSVRLDVASGRPLWVSPMRPQCHDGVTIANGLLYWWPWACDCQLTLYGVTALGPAGGFDFYPQATEAQRLETAADSSTVAELPTSPADWPTFRSNNQGTVTSAAVIPANCGLMWQLHAQDAHRVTPSAPVAAGGLIFVAGSDGIVRALDAASGQVRWTAYTGGAIRFPPTIYQGRALVGAGDGWVYAFEAQTGRVLWRFRAAPTERKMPVYGSLLSTWPAASGILVQDGVAYLAAGIVNYDGTYVYALDAATGHIKWQNNTSGHLEPDARTGVSVQGHMLIHDGKLYLAGGNAVSPAIYDLTDGKCLNDAAQLRDCVSVYPRGWELFLIGDKIVVSGKPFYTDPRYPVFDKTVTEKLLHASNGHKDIVWQNNRELMCFAPIDRQLLSNCVTPPPRRARGALPPWGKFKIPDQPLWAQPCDDSVAVALCRNAVVVAKPSELVALSIEDGKALWVHPLPAPPVPWGLAVDHQGRTVVTLQDGQVLCFGPQG